MTVDLKPCPFCGGAASLDEDHHSPGFSGACRACDFSLEYRKDRADAIAAWNRRAPEGHYVEPSPTQEHRGERVDQESEGKALACRIDFEKDGRRVDDIAISGELISMFRLEAMDRDQFWGAVFMRDGRSFRLWFDGSKARSLKVTGEWE